MEFPPWRQTGQKIATPPLLSVCIWESHSQSHKKILIGDKSDVNDIYLNVIRLIVIFVSRQSMLFIILWSLIRGQLVLSKSPFPPEYFMQKVLKSLKKSLKGFIFPGILPCSIFLVGPSHVEAAVPFLDEIVSTRGFDAHLGWGFLFYAMLHYIWF